MSETRTIRLPKTMPLVDRIAMVSRQISEWLDSLEEPFNIDADTMHLAKMEGNGKYVYHYIIERSAKGPEKKRATSRLEVKDGPAGN